MNSKVNFKDEISARLPHFTEEERLHYDKKASSLLENDLKAFYLDQNRKLETGATSKAYESWQKLIKQVDLTSAESKVLDYCCGQGLHAITLQKLIPFAEVHGIDISPSALEFGQKVAAANLPTSHLPLFRVMDAHHLDYPDESFNLVSNFEGLSSLQFENAVSEILRVLKPGGAFIGIETLGHNPLFNWNRKLNVWRGKRTSWSEQNILKQKKLEYLRARLTDWEAHYHCLFPAPFQALRVLDRKLLTFFPALEKYAFKVVWLGRKK